MATKSMPSRTSRPSSTPKSKPRPKQTRLDFSKSTGKTSTRPKAQPNASILTFFKKTDAPQHMEPGLFLETRGKSGSMNKEQDWDHVVGWDDHESSSKDITEASRFNEDGGSMKKRRVSLDEDERRGSRSLPPSSHGGPSSTTKRPSGPFLEESDSEEEENTTLRKSPPQLQAHQVEEKEDIPPVDAATTQPANEEVGEESDHDHPGVPPLKREPTSFFGNEGFDEFEELGNFDEFEDEEDFGDEERRWMQEQRKLGLEDADLEPDSGDSKPDFTDGAELDETNDTTLISDAPTCPICSLSLEGASDQDASIHVNNCLDGNPTALPSTKESADGRPPPAVHGAQRFQRPAKPAKPGQATPFSLGAAEGGSTSAFAKLMSGHAEDSAWATAAAAENASRGKPSYQRTCPFYKILPGFSICVDAFRYGAVQGCEAYFLSHFHSDHYIGLTANWRHGPIYCSRVTANLVRQQLRVDPKFVVGLEWEKPTEVPQTGVTVTMIPANHCPGSSLFLFEKPIGKGQNPRMQRVLHCGDFRACRAHIEHPLLRPDVLDAVSGKTRQQKLDVCYLDTTYLNPKYAFPSQGEVIKACADMCVSLNRVRADDTDGWEQMKRERAGKGMANFVRKNSDLVNEEDNDEDVDAMKLSKGTKNRGRLLVVVGTYSIGKERMCLGIAKAMDSKIFAPPGKMRICRALEDAELDARLTTDPRAAQVHMTPLFEIRAETLDDYLKDYRDTFARAVGFRPTGWNYRPPNSRFTESPLVQTVLHSGNWKSGFSMRDLVPQRGSTGRASSFGVPYSEHSSFRELTMFCCALRIDKIIPTVNVGSAKSRERMKGWCEKWAQERRKNGLFKPEQGECW
ncbi:dna repair metallo-beta-lactamase [Diplodia corticola]|uniref:Dna repair metallo-beta-lactamase n=1 Tax=Diplodia corticola TaxID=236234 RepID=A0A1J9QZI7_9PEZI|nr:dna repair metallo-beta-lactamase [Diplodia corticola]OJD33808.1 dna repair metallo-beta-lactamase [Diplodia corticola]